MNKDKGDNRAFSGNPYPPHNLLLVAIAATSEEQARAKAAMAAADDEEEEEEFDDYYVKGDTIYGEDMKLLYEAGYEDTDLDIMDREEFLAALEDAGVDPNRYAFDLDRQEEG